MTTWGHLLAARALLQLARIARRWGKRRLARRGGGLWLTRGLFAVADGLVLQVARHAVRALGARAACPRLADRMTGVLVTLSSAALALSYEAVDRSLLSQALAAATVICLLAATVRGRDPAAKSLTEWDLSAGLCLCTAIVELSA
ncbi:hypothetical protein [Methylobacterium fujisawaense]|uniref:hypothetical protein n=1 Tax=Methylobacterium fujisawaense TaxID=107400 RepID=UPI002F35E27E